MKWVLVDQRVPGYVTRSKTTRVEGSIQWEEYNKLLMHIVDSMAQWIQASLMLRPWLQSWWLTPTQVSLLHPWIFRDYFCVVESNKQQIKEIRSKSKLENKGNFFTSESGFVSHLVAPSLSLDRRIRNYHHSSASLTTNAPTCVVRYFASLGFFPFFVVLGPPISFNFI